MAKIADDIIYSSLGVRLPDSYLKFVNAHFKDLDDDPLNRCCWRSGFGSLPFVLGTTQAFRDQFKDFPKDLVVIGYIGPKKILIDHQETDIDVFVALNGATSEVFYVDTFGKIEKVADSFDSWVDGFIAWMSDKPKPASKLSLARFLEIIKGTKKRENNGR
jgi:hypothetical protein